MNSDLVKLSRKGAFIIGRFSAMACPCEIMLETNNEKLAQTLIQLGVEEARRIEQKFSRFRQDSVVSAVNRSSPQAMKVDEETAQLLNFSQTAWEMSEGLFDITSGAFRTIWDFKSRQIPSQQAINNIKHRVGWQHINWQEPFISMPADMQIDLGGVGKEYAVDKVALLIKQAAIQNTPALVNFGGDLCALDAPKTQGNWYIGIEDPQQTGKACLQSVKFKQGALATSGDARQHIMFEGERYGHIINPTTGFPTKNAPRSVTVMSETCVQAGLYSTLAILHGEAAESFLQMTGCRYWIVN